MNLATKNLRNSTMRTLVRPRKGLNCVRWTVEPGLAKQATEECGARRADEVETLMHCTLKKKAMRRRDTHCNTITFLLKYLRCYSYSGNGEEGDMMTKLGTLV